VNACSRARTRRSSSACENPDHRLSLREAVLHALVEVIDFALEFFIESRDRFSKRIEAILQPLDRDVEVTTGLGVRRCVLLLDDFQQMLQIFFDHSVHSTAGWKLIYTARVRISGGFAAALFGIAMTLLSWYGPWGWPAWPALTTLHLLFVNGFDELPNNGRAAVVVMLIVVNVGFWGIAAYGVGALYSRYRRRLHTPTSRPNDT